MDIKRFKNLSFLIIIVSIVFVSMNFSVKSMVVQRPFRYLFFQQFDDMCTIAPMLNRYKLQELKVLGQNFSDQAFNDPVLALTRQQWFGESFQYLFSWRKFLIDFMNSEIGKNYLTQAAQNGLVTPNFYNRRGKNLFDKDKFAIVKYPYFFADLSSKKIKKEMSTNFYVPIINYSSEFVLLGDEAEWQIYNKQSKIFEPFTYDKLQNNPIFSSIKMSILSNQPDLQDQYNFSYVQFAPKRLGFSLSIMPNDYWLKGFKENDEASEKMPYCLGFLKLMFLVLGINSNNENIVEGDSEYQICTKIKELIQVDRDNNPWSDKFFVKEYFMQYALAEIFKNNQALYQKAVKTIDIVGKKIWQTYDDIISGKLILYKDNQGTRYNLVEIIKYLPGRHQALASFFTESLRLLWYGAASKNAVAYYKALDLHEAGHPYKNWFAAWLSGLKFSKIKKNAEKQFNGISFLSVWLEIKNELQKLYPDIQDWVSFDDHGWVISFDQNLIKMQNDIAIQNKCDDKLLKELGFAGIESWWGHELETFYKR